MNDYTPDWVSPPGETIADLADEAGLTLAQLAERLGMSIADTATLIDGVLPLDGPIGLKLAEVFGPSAEFWRNREA